MLRFWWSKIRMMIDTTEILLWHVNLLFPGVYISPYVFQATQQELTNISLFFLLYFGNFCSFYFPAKFSSYPDFIISTETSAVARTSRGTLFIPNIPDSFVKGTMLKCCGGRCTAAYRWESEKGVNLLDCIMVDSNGSLLRKSSSPTAFHFAICH